MDFFRHFWSGLTSPFAAELARLEAKDSVAETAALHYRLEESDARVVVLTQRLQAFEATESCAA